MRRAFSTVLLVWLGVGGCANTGSVVCDDGTTCPNGYACDVDHDRCLGPDQLVACDGLAENAECSLDGQQGTCRSGACEPWFCGNGHREGTELCDGPELGVDGDHPADCVTAGYYERAGLQCTALCTYDTSACAGGHCGDNTVNGPELCDGSTNRTCISIGFDAGSVRCDGQCGLTIRDCSRFGWNPESLTDVIAYALGGSSPTDQWAVGDRGRAMRFEGAFWNTVPTGFTQNLVGVAAISPTDAFVVGQSNVSPARASIVGHYDGDTWSVMPDVPAAEYIDIWGTKHDEVFVATDGGVLRYDGATWAKVGALTDKTIRISGTSASDVWVATIAGPTKHWNGSTWMDISPPNAEIHFVDANAPDDVWVAGSNKDDLGIGLVAHWNGSTWQIWRTPSTTYNAIASSAPNDTWVAGADGIIRHWDGVAWSSSLSVGASPSGLAAISGFVSFGPGDVVAVSTLNLAYRYRGQTFGILPPLGSNPFDAPNNTAILTFAPDDVWVTNVHGDVDHYDGTTWTTEFSIAGDTTSAMSIAGTSASNLWVGGMDGAVYHYDGLTWTMEQVTASSAVRRMWTDGTDVWAFAGPLALHRTAPDVWESFAPPGQSIRSVSGTDGTHLYIVVTNGGLGTLYTWDGTTWTEVITSSTTQLLSVLVVADDDIHVTAKDGRLSHWDGSAWREMVVPSLADLEFITATAHDDVIAASQRDLFHFDGTQWSMMRPPVDFVPNTPDFLPIAGITASPGRVDMMLVRHRVRTLIRTRPITCRTQETDCHDSVDDDCDGLIDALDDQCR